MEMGIGETCGYRASVKDRLVAVEVLRIGERKPLRVQVSFLGEDAEGHVKVGSADTSEARIPRTLAHH